MLTKSAIKKIEKALNTKAVQDGNTFVVVAQNVTIEIQDQEGDCLFIVVRRSHDVNDSMTDYCAGGMYYTIKSAIERFNYLVA